MSELLKSYVGGDFQAGEEGLAALINPTTDEVVAQTSTAGIDMAGALAYARDTGGPGLRALSFAQRAELLGKASKALHAHRDELLDLSTLNGGNTRGDAKFDVDGATGTLAYYAKLGANLSQTPLLGDGETELLGRSPRMVGRHVLAPLHGVAVHINAFNFPAWGFAEKAAVAWLAGMPVLTKPATSTALLTARMVEILIEDQVLPSGALSLLCGSAGDLLDHLTWQDVVAFTGSADTGLKIRSNENILRQGVRVGIEADSLNAAVLGPDMDDDSELFDRFIQDVAKEITQKAGQKCTAIRRILVPEAMVAKVGEALAAELAAVKVGNPAEKGIKMGPLNNGQQLADVKAGLDALRAEAKTIHGDGGRGELHAVDADKGSFVSPVLLEASDGLNAKAIHHLEVFGPVSTLVAYDGSAEQSAQLLGLGQGSLVASVYSDDKRFTTDLVNAGASFQGRLFLASSKVSDHVLGPGAVLPASMHGGPGRAGGGEELGGRVGLKFYMQRLALQGYAPLLERLAQ